MRTPPPALGEPALPRTRADTGPPRRPGGRWGSPSGSSNPGFDLLLKVTPPRLPRHLVTRSRLLSTGASLRDQPFLLVQAPAGFGKTALLAQWRREQLAHGAVVAWVHAQPQDRPQRLVQTLALAVRAGAGRPTFGKTLLEAEPTSGIEGFTAWLAEVAQAAFDLVLFVDNVECLPAQSVEALAYVLRNAPPNLRVVVAARTECHLGVDDLVAYGRCTVVTQEALRFQFEETLEVVAKRFGPRIDADSAARLHELTDGWPLGLQLALSAVGSGSDAATVAAGPVLQGHTLHEHFMRLLLANLDSADVAFLCRIAILDHIHADLCHVLVPSSGAAARLARMARETPIFIADEGEEWLRMHGVARDALRLQFAALPAREQSALHIRAADWLAARGLIEAAAGHALSAGQFERAYQLAERSLYDSLMTQGHQDHVLEWLGRLPSGELDRRPRLLLAAAWSLALGQRHGEADGLVARLLALPGVNDATRCECALILGAAALFADDPDHFAELHDFWAEPPLRDPLLLKIHANRSARRALLDGDPALARLREQRPPTVDPATKLRYLDLWGDYITGYSYLWEGQVRLAEQVLRPALARADNQLGRRAPFAAQLASLLAAVVWERNQPAEATALLANRLDVIERGGLPETVQFAYVTLARAAAVDAEDRALELLGAMHAIGAARRWPRLCIASLTEQVRLHARRFRAETCRDLCAEIDSVLAQAGRQHGRLWHRDVELWRDVARGHAAIAAREWRQALDPLGRADARAMQLKQGRLRIALLGLRALVLDRCSENSADLLYEATDLAQAYGLERVFDDAHPVLGDWVRQTTRSRPGAEPTLADPAAAPIRTPQPGYEAGREHSTPSMALTPKEREVLELLARSLSNKEIGLALQAGEATIKWHVKNLFAKFDAGTRKQVVQRARIQGLLEIGPPG
jgi:LuxR family transcriptional regulator, maltose regulon positive regulatory protein